MTLMSSDAPFSGLGTMAEIRITSVRDVAAVLGVMKTAPEEDIEGGFDVVVAGAYSVPVCRDVDGHIGECRCGAGLQKCPVRGKWGRRQ